MKPLRPTWALGCVVLAVLLHPTTAIARFSGFDPDGNGTSYPAAANGRKTSVPFTQAHALNGIAVELDGRLDDPAWLAAPGATGFHQWDPDRGEPPSEETVFKVLYDHDAVYFGVACYEADASKISASLSRRDEFTNSDIVSIYIDPYLDHTTGYNFKVNPRGVQVDAYVYNDGDMDQDWDAVWQAETFRDGDGWYVEMRIPFSSIRYRSAESMTWGLQVYRYMHSRGEDTSWVTWDRETRGFVSRFGELRGIRDVPSPRQLELLPYFVQKGVDHSVPGRDGFESSQNVGTDVKYGVTADLTLNATIQPDFGQVEADPAVVNLSPFETFFDEKRPFFVEGARFFQHPNFNLFYSRRIGTGHEFSRIRAAGKLTGKTAGGISVAALAAATDVTLEGQSHNVFKSGDQRSYYAVGRFGKESRQGAFRFNLMGTAVNHSADRDAYDDEASREAYTGGLDFDLNFHNRDYNIQGSVVGSLINHEDSRVDPEVTGRKQYGSGGNLEIRKLGGTIRGGVWGGWESDELELNDVGFLSSPDEIYGGFWGQYLYNPDGKSNTFNQGNLNYNYWKSWLYGGRIGTDVNTGEEVWAYEPHHRQYNGTNVNGWMQFRNYWEGWFGIEYMWEGTQRYETRGGPLMTEPTTYGGWWGVMTDTRKKVNFWLEGSHYRDVIPNHSTNVEIGARLNQSSAVNHRLTVRFKYRLDDTQYLETVDLGERPGGLGIGGQSYVFGKIHQRELDVTLRTNILFSRNQSLELYMQPFISVGDFTQARELHTPDSYDLIPYAESGFDVSSFDFRYTSVNINLVYRWEYRPGSTIYLVWTHARETDEERNQFSDPTQFNTHMTSSTLFRNEPVNTLLVKATYWLTL